tara:strand:- start:153 stop:287 length:135 start_codon:yes stop_codon:yes gene_type:complete
MEGVVDDEEEPDEGGCCQRDGTKLVLAMSLERAEGDNMFLGDDN